MDYSNSNKKQAMSMATGPGKATTPAPTQIASGSIKKKNIGEKACELFFNNSDIRAVGRDMFEKVIKPGIRDFVYSTLNRGLHQAMYGTAPTTPYTNSPFGAVYKNYSAISSPTMASTTYNPMNAGYDIGQIVISGNPATGMTGEEAAEQVIVEMTNTVKEYGFVTVAHLYGLLGMDTNPQAFKYGWRSETWQNVGTINTAQGVMLRLPKATPNN